LEQSEWVGLETGDGIGSTIDIDRTARVSIRRIIAKDGGAGCEMDGEGMAKTKPGQGQVAPRQEATAEDDTHTDGQDDTGTVFGR
jgi:hypothetical protein